MNLILVVEDEQAISEVIIEILQDADYNVMTASNGLDGLKLVAQQLPDLIICDVMMPILDGRGFCAAIRANTTYSTIPVIMMSAGSYVTSSECDYAAFIYKPFDIDGLLAVVSQVLEK